MSMGPPNPFNTLQTFHSAGDEYSFYSLPALEAAGFNNLRRLPVSLRLVLESLMRNCDGQRVTEPAVRTLASWQPNTPRTEEIPFVVARIVLQDFTGVPLLVDLAAMRSAVARLRRNPKIIEPLVPVDLVVDHSVQVDVNGSPEAFARNLEIEFTRNRERYQFLKWGMQAFQTFKVVPPGIGIIHQVNLEYLAKGVLIQESQISNLKSQIAYPDTLVGTDSHTTMINGLGIVGWGVGGIEAEAGMLGQPVYFLTPDVVGVHLTGALVEGVTATDLVLTVTQLLRKAKVVGKFVEFFGPGAVSLPVVDRATIGNMAPEYGATMGFFPIDAECTRYLRATGRSDEHVRLYEDYYRAQGLWGIPQKGEIDYSQVVDLDLGTVVPSVAGPKRPQDRIELPRLKQEFTTAFARPVAENGFGKKAEEFATVSAEVALNGSGRAHIGHGSVLIAAITSCTNTSNPSVMLAAGLLAKKAVERGLTVNPAVKASLAPGSRVVSEYLAKAGLQPYLDQLGFNLVGYGCTTCIGNSGPLRSAIEEAVVKYDLVAASVLSGNRNFEARIHQNIKANFLMSPPLVVAFALAGRVDIDLSAEPLGTGRDGRPVLLRDIWPTLQEVRDQLQSALKPEVFRRLYADFAAQNPKWNDIPSATGDVFPWDSRSTYIQEPPFFTHFTVRPPGIIGIEGARPLGIFGDSVTTDHISPAGSIKKASPAGQFLLERGVKFEDFNSYGSRRGNDRVMTRGTFANVRIKNQMLGGEEGGNTIYFPPTQVKFQSGPGGRPVRIEAPLKRGGKMSIFDAAMQYAEDGVPLLVIAGHEYGTGSSRDWAAKGANLLGVRAVVAQSFERIHRSNLVGMGVLPLQFMEEVNARTLKLDGTETYDIAGLTPSLKPQQDLVLRVRRQKGEVLEVPVRCRIDTPIEIEYYRHGGILPYVLRQILARN
ncbi:MAG: aconitate hydratase 1 [Verrucomicrobia bacterium RIFCSPLOWO2_12_FULL_64_8]|nr:MAG: aconitate hydratase 1 [Verrucomicrobia bacterium RIFCSPLOWO2_12_FULL_64_8]